MFSVLQQKRQKRKLCHIPKGFIIWSPPSGFGTESRIKTSAEYQPRESNVCPNNLCFRHRHVLPPFGWFAFLTGWNRLFLFTRFGALDNLLLIHLICPSASIPGRLFPCYFRRIIKHCGINNGLTSSGFSSSCLQTCWTCMLLQEIRQDVHTNYSISLSS